MSRELKQPSDDTNDIVALVKDVFTSRTQQRILNGISKLNTISNDSITRIDPVQRKSPLNGEISINNNLLHILTAEAEPKIAIEFTRYLAHRFVNNPYLLKTLIKSHRCLIEEGNYGRSYVLQNPENVALARFKASEEPAMQGLISELKSLDKKLEKIPYTHPTQPDEIGLQEAVSLKVGTDASPVEFLERIDKKKHRYIKTEKFAAEAATRHFKRAAGKRNMFLGCNPPLIPGRNYSSQISRDSRSKQRTESARLGPVAASGQKSPPAFEL